MNVSKTTTATIIGEVTVEELLELLKDHPSGAKVSFTKHEGDRPYDSGYITITITDRT